MQCFSFTVLILHHLKSVERDIEKWTCNICSRIIKFSNKQNHLRIHEENYIPPSRIKKHICEYCGESFVIKTQLDYHLRKHVGMALGLVCKICGNADFVNEERIYIRDVCLYEVYMILIVFHIGFK